MLHLRFVYTLAGYIPDDTPRKVKKVKEFLKIETRKKKKKKALIWDLVMKPLYPNPSIKLKNPTCFTSIMQIRRWTSDLLNKSL